MSLGDENPIGHLSEDQPESKKSRETYLEYVRALRDRLANQARQNGTTKWALGGAILYLVLKTVPDLGKFIEGQLPHNFAWVTFAHTQNAIFSAWLVYEALSYRLSRSRYDYRFKLPETLQQAIISFAGLAPALAWATASCVIALASDSVTHPFESKLLHVSAWFWGFILVGGAIATLGGGQRNWTPDAKSGENYPTPDALDIQSTRAKVASILGLVALILLLSHSYFVVRPSFDVAAPLYGATVSLGLGIALLTVAVLLFISFIPQSERLETLDRLERDIVLHDLSTDEARRRLEAEYLGHEFSGWLDGQLKTLAHDGEALQKHIGREGEFFTQLDALSADLVHEKTGRIRAYEDEVRAVLGRFDQRRERLELCLRGLRAKSRRDSFLSSSLDKYLGLLGDLASDSKDPGSRLLRRLQKKAEEIGQQTKGVVK